MRQPIGFVEFAAIRSNSLVVGITAVVGLIGGVVLITQTTKTFIGKVSDRKNKEASAAAGAATAATVAGAVSAVDGGHLCNVCCAELNLEDAKSSVKCSICQKRICRNIKCAAWQPRTAQWECELCQSSKESLAQTSSWVAEQISFNQQKLVYPIRARSEIFIPISDSTDSFMHFESVSQAGGQSTTAISAEQKLKIREYVEEVVAKLLGGSLDHIRVGQMSKSENYLPSLAKGQNGSVVSATSAASADSGAARNATNDFSDLSQTRLRQLIQTIIAETMHVPASLPAHAVSEVALDTRSKTAHTLPLTNGHRHRTEHYFEPKIYQDLLATAVLNKIVDSQQANVRALSESTPELSRMAAADQNFNAEDHSVSSGSSVEPRSDCSYTDVEQMLHANSNGESPTPLGSVRDLNTENSFGLHFDAGRQSVMSDYIAAHMVPLPDLSAPATESDEDEYTSVASSAVGEGTWEDNWLFKKKRATLSSSVSAASAGMLVPAPREDVRAQIGDKTADEVSDLSEMGSDADDSSLDSLHTKLDPLNDRLLNKHLIGGQNTKMVLDELIESAASVKNEATYAEARNEHIADHPSPQTEAINRSVQKPPQADATSGDPPLLQPPAGFEDPTTKVDSTPLTDRLGRHTSATAVGAHFAKSGPEPFAKQNLPQNPNNSFSFNCNSNTTTNDNGTTAATSTNNTNKSRTAGRPTAGPRAKRTSDSRRHSSASAVEVSVEVAVAAAVSAAESHLSVNNEEQHVARNMRLFAADNERANSDEAGDGDESGVAVLRRLVPGSIAEREYMKWYNAVEMPNNPYAPEALRKRITSGSQERFIDLPNISPTCGQTPVRLMQKDDLAANEANRENDYKRYRRDYYINDDGRQAASSSSDGHHHHPKPADDSNSAPNNSNNSNSNNNSNIIINEPPQPPPETAAETYQALPVLVKGPEDSASLESNSLRSANTSTSDDSDTVRIYDFRKQKTTTIVRDTKPVEPEKPPPPVEQRRRSAPSPIRTAAAVAPVAATRGCTPTAFKFLQPKRKLIEPSEVLSLDEDEPAKAIVAKPLERPVIEKDVVKALPSVKALARAFLLTSSIKSTTWPRKAEAVVEVKKEALNPAPVKLEEPSPSPADVAEDATIASDLSSLETDPSGYKEAETTKDFQPNASAPDAATGPNTSPTKPGCLKSNIAFFENLKFK